jgi:hypothetical protein
MGVIVLISIALTVLQTRADPEIHLIPIGYTGQVTIAFGAANGDSAAWEGTARVYTIPENGILLTSSEPNVGSSPEWRFFQVRPDGERIAISRVWGGWVQDTPENRAHPGVEVFAIGAGRLQAGRIACDVQFLQYFVGTRLQLLTRDQQAERRRLSEFLAKNFACS